MEAKLTAIGIFAPEKVIDNHYFEKIVDTNDEWIRSRTGIITRHYAGEDEFTSDLAQKAIENMAAEYHLQLDDVDFILVATVTHDQIMPSMACQLQYRLNMPKAAALDISAACGGFAYGLVLAKGLINSGMYRKILVVGAETLSKVTDFTDRTSCILFGDGAGVVLIEAAEKGNIGASVAGADGSGGQDLYLSTQNTWINGEEIKANNKIVQNGRKVFKWAVSQMALQFNILLEKEGLSVEDIDWFVPHSANMRIIEAICKQVGLPIEKTLESLSTYGNTSSASIPLALYEGLRAGKVKKGDRVMMLGFGGGLTYAGAIVQWA
ncbi:MAG: ketoacyl-ACP synthase III [Phaeodactylibacter sp.]|nr:ketoacyl-ACP synthase III [Phaeodactylibacter sp.]MCB9302578.1 ketoacyl-ACP synthase III [Lewinellaceae bacterium]HQU59629.1 ketoacyl-ACP synthase III [Saprospiraceae bacterium]